MKRQACEEGCCSGCVVGIASMAQALRQRIAPLINKVQQTVTPMYSASEKQVMQQYEKMMKGGEQYVVKDKAQADKLLKQWFYTNMAR